MDKQSQELAMAALERMEGNIRTLKSLISGKTSSNISSATVSETITKAKAEPSPSGPKQPKNQAKLQTAQSLSADQLGPTPDFKSDMWPQAVSPHLIVSNETDDPIKKRFRAVQMIGLMGVATAGLRVLDCGCGEGYTTSEIAGNNASNVIGYDITRFGVWDNFQKPNLMYTTDRKTVESQKPFDFIVLYDVIDHLEGENPDEFLSWVASLLSPGGKVFLRCHPWTARHGGHLYEKMNKAYIHLALTTDELVRAGLKTISNLKITRPLATYDNLIAKAGFAVVNRKGHTEPVEDFFSGEILDRIIKVTWNGAIDHQTALKIMSNQFVDYVLTSQ